MENVNPKFRKLISRGLLLAISVLSFSCSRTPGAGELLVQEAMRLTDDESAKLELAQANLLCSQGLPGSLSLDVDSIVETLESWAAHAKSETERHLYRFHQNPKEFGNSEPYFRSLMLVTVLQQDMGVSYNIELIQSGKMNDAMSLAFFKDASDVFLNGAIAKRTGSCASMPVLVCAVGRQLGYPLKLVRAKGHLFCRWEGERQKLNLEVSGRGLNVYPDEYYRKWPHPITDADMATGAYLASMTPKQEFACFLELRGACLLANGRTSEAAEALKLSVQLWPESEECRLLLSRCVSESKRKGTG
jgi:hypothetical protein